MSALAGLPHPGAPRADRDVAGEREDQDQGQRHQAEVGQQRQLRAVAEGAGDGRRPGDEVQAAEQHGADQGDADGGPEPLGGAQDPAGRPGLLARHRRQHEVLVGRDRHAGAQPGQQQRAGQVPAAGGGGGEVDHHDGQAQADQHHRAAEHQHPPAEPRRQPGAVGRRDQLADRERRGHQAGGQRRVAETHLPQDRQREEDAAEAAEERDGEDRAGGERGLPQQGRLEQRVAAAPVRAPLPGGERGEHDHAAAEARSRSRPASHPAAPAPGE